MRWGLSPESTRTRGQSPDTPRLRGLSPSGNETLDGRIDACVRELRDEIVAFTSELVAIASENPPGNAYPACVRALTSKLRALGLPCERVPYRAGRRGRDAAGAAILLSGIGAGPRTLYFSGHYDVVPVIRANQCTPQRRGRTLFGRGTADMKGGLASMLYAAVALQRLKVPLDGRVGLVFVPDEETGGHRGSGFLDSIGRLGSNGIGMLTPEPTSGVIWHANRGAITMRVTVHGREAHVGLLHQGRNAFEDAMRVAAGLQRLARRTSRRRTRFRLTPDAARRSILLIGGRVEAGSNFNVVPGRCVFTVDRRINPEEDFDAERDALLDVFAEARRAGIALDVEVLQEGRPSGSPATSPLGRALGQQVRAVTGKAARFEMCPGLLEIRFYAQHGMPAYAYGPGLLAVAHGPREFVHISRLVECAAIYARTAATVLAPSADRGGILRQSTSDPIRDRGGAHP
jgi:acetylornithine deacetylase/succinyl-diaminopimelate desuccinylase family protein